MYFLLGKLGCLFYTSFENEDNVFSTRVLGIMFSSHFTLDYRVAALRWAFKDCGYATYFLCVKQKFYILNDI